MIKIKLKKTGKGSSRLVINGRIDEDSYALEFEDRHWIAAVYDHECAAQLVACRASELEKYFEKLDVPFEAEWNEFIDSVGLKFFETSYKLKKRHLRRSRHIYVAINPNFETWAKPYSIIEYAEAIEAAAKEFNMTGVSYHSIDSEAVSSGFGIRCKMRSGNPILREEIERCSEYMHKVSEMADRALALKASHNSITTFFNFPTQIKTACEQYLLYFIQFLGDLGIGAHAEIKENAHRVLFSVTPKDGLSSLERIREALAVYLRLPDTPFTNTDTGVNMDIAARQLQANIFHLQSQLALASATLQAKDATIQALQISSFQYKQLSMTEAKTAEKGEPLVGDTIHLQKINKMGVSVDLPLILKRLKRVFGST